MMVMKRIRVGMNKRRGGGIGGGDWNEVDGELDGIDDNVRQS